MTVSQPVSIIAPPGIYAGISVTAGGVGLTVNAGSGKVTLRGLSINNITGGTSGISFQSGASLYVDNVTVTNFPSAGLAANVGATSSVHVTNSTFRDNGTGAVFSASVRHVDGQRREHALRPQRNRDSTSATVPLAPFTSRR